MGSRVTWIQDTRERREAIYPGEPNNSEQPRKRWRDRLNGAEYEYLSKVVEEREEKEKEREEKETSWDFLLKSCVFNPDYMDERQARGPHHSEVPAKLLR